MIEGIRHTGIVVRDLERTKNFYLKLGFKIQSQAREKGSFIESVTGIKDVNIEWIKMNLPDGNLLELIKYFNPATEKEKYIQEANQLGVSHLAFNIRNIDLFCNNVIKLGGSIINPPSLTDNKLFKVAYCHDVEGNLFEAVERQNEK